MLQHFSKKVVLKLFWEKLFFKKSETVLKAAQAGTSYIGVCGRNQPLEAFGDEKIKLQKKLH